MSIFSYLSNLANKTKEYLSGHGDINEIIDRAIKFNRISLVTISQDLDEYESGGKSNKRIYLVAITRIMMILTALKLLMCAIMREVN